MRNLNPKWDEKFNLMVEDLSKTIDVRVYDYDRGLRDDWMGSAAIDPSTLTLNMSVSSSHVFQEARPISQHIHNKKLS